MTTAIKQSNLSQEQIDRFQKDGFLLVENFFSNEEIDRYRQYVDQAVAYRTADDQRLLADKIPYEQTFTQCMRLWEDHPDVALFTFHPKLCAAAAALLKIDCVRLWHDQALYKESGGRKTDAHLDFPFWPVDKDDLISAWIPFADVEPGGGVMSYVQSSHRSGVTEFADIGELHDDEMYDILSHPKIKDLPVIPVQAKKGCVIFHHACTVHLADANETAHTRRVFTTAYMADGLRRSIGARVDRYFSLDRDNIIPGELVKGPGHPVAWPRSSEKLPPPPKILGPKTGFGASEADKFQ